jgi:hypothetical protein
MSRGGWLLDAIDTNTLVGIRDSPLIRLVCYTVARVVHMNVED